MASSCRREVLRLQVMAVALSCLYALTDSETSHYTWRLDAGTGKVLPAVASAVAPPASGGSRTKSAKSTPTLAPRHEAAASAQSGVAAAAAASAARLVVMGGQEELLQLQQQENVLEILLSTEPMADGTWKKTWNTVRHCARCRSQYHGQPAVEAASANLQRWEDANGGDDDDSDGDVDDEDADIGDDDDVGDVGGPALAPTTFSGNVAKRVGGGSNRTNRAKGKKNNNGDGAGSRAEEVLDCGKPVNFTFYDHLVGIQNRAGHPHIPEPEVALTFKNGLFTSPSSSAQLPAAAGGLKEDPTGDEDGGKDDDSRAAGGRTPTGGAASRAGKPRAKVSSASVEVIEQVLRRARREKPKSVELYNQMGNFWRVKGDTQRSIECFRRALAVSPNNAEILLNLARVLFNLQYLDDAIFLTRRSLEVQPPDQNAWAQHFQLGEILKAYCHYQEAALHLRHVLELKPNYGPALSALADMEAMPDSAVHLYTVFIIVFLVLAVLLWVLSTLDVRLEELLNGVAGFGLHGPASSRAASAAAGSAAGSLTSSSLTESAVDGGHAHNGFCHTHGGSSSSNGKGSHRVHAKNGKKLMGFGNGF